ncbi:MAG: slipin family protein [Ruminococcaceae bacterium]|nr:slipin family protein [Oscillospiraceae bacterium]
MKTIIHENERGLLYRDGKFTGLLSPGKYHHFDSTTIEKLPLDAAIAPKHSVLDTLLENRGFASAVNVVSVPDGNIALRFSGKNFVEALLPGRYAYFRAAGFRVRMVDTRAPEISSLPRTLINKLPPELVLKVKVMEHQRALLFYDNKLRRVLECGTYYFWRGGVEVSAQPVDMRRTQLLITGQELMTADKIAIRVSFVCNYRITDCVMILTQVDDYCEQIRMAAQLAMREYVSGQTLDAILAGREKLAKAVSDKLNLVAPRLYVEISDCGVRDIILPGEIREIMNTVLIAEKRAQANVITRREEVASTRSLLNTAKLMDENATLRRLKELEYLEKISTNVGSIQVHLGEETISKLTKE